MKLRNAILTHSILLLSPPIYLISEWYYNPTATSHHTPTSLALALALWLYILTRVTIPVLTSPLLSLPSPPGDTFPFGHFWMFRVGQPPLHLQRATSLAPSSSGIIAFYSPFYLSIRLLLTSPTPILAVTNTHNYDWEKPVWGKRLIRRVLGSGLINAEGAEHKAMRKAVAPAFSGRQIRELVPAFWAKGTVLGDVVAEEARGKAEREGEREGEVEVLNLMSRITLDIIGEATIGIDFQTIHGDENRLAKLYDTAVGADRGPIVPFAIVNLVFPQWVVRRMKGTVWARVANAVKELRSSVRVLLAEKKENFKQDGTGHRDILGTIMRSGDFSDVYLRDQLLTFFAAGHDTTAGALTWAIWLLSLNPQIQDRLRSECQQHLPSSTTDPITADAFDTMPYLTAICNETLRLYPTVTATARQAAIDTKIGGLHVPKGTNVIMSPWAMNRDPTLWGDDADTFNPDRWIDGPLASQGGARSPYAFMTFIYGPRSCIGQAFARAEMKCLLAALVLRFRFEPSASRKEVEFGGIVAIKPKNGMRLKVVEL